MRTWLYHKTLPATIYDKSKDDMETLHAEGWRDSPVRLTEDEQLSDPVRQLHPVKLIVTKKKP